MLSAPELWSDGLPVEAGQVFFDQMSYDSRVKWGTQVLDAALKVTKIRSWSVCSLSKIAKSKWRWRAAKSIFNRLRNKTLRLERLRSPTIEQRQMLCLLLLAENVAKVVYNASEPSDPFDEDSAEWILPCVKGLIDLTDNEELALQIHSILLSDAHAD